MVATNSITATDVKALKAEADSKKAEAQKLKTALANAKAHVDGLIVERAALPTQKTEAVLAGDIKGYARVLDREKLLPAEITIGEIAAARAAVAYHEANAAWARAYRTLCSTESQRIGKNAGYPEGQPKGVRADGEYENSRGIVHSASGPLGEAQRHLYSLIEQASRVR